MILITQQLNCHKIDKTWRKTDDIITPADSVGGEDEEEGKQLFWETGSRPRHLLIKGEIGLEALR